MAFSLITAYRPIHFEQSGSCNNGAVAITLKLKDYFHNMDKETLYFMDVDVRTISGFIAKDDASCAINIENGELRPSEDEKRTLRPFRRINTTKADTQPGTKRSSMSSTRSNMGQSQSPTPGSPQEESDV